MFQRSLIAYSLLDTEHFLAAEQVRERIANSRSALVQIFAWRADPAFLRSLHARIREAIPYAVVVGATSSGEISSGNSMKRSTVVSFTFFDSAELFSVVRDCSGGSEFEAGADIARRLKESAAEIKGVLLLATTMSIDGGKLLEGLREGMGEFPLFGAGAGAYDNQDESYVFEGDRMYDQGAVAVAFAGSELHIDAYTYTGWQPLSKEMTITEAVHSKLVKTIDGLPAASIYEKYLGIARDQAFFDHIIEFPFLLRRDGHELARNPFSCEEDGSLHFVADVREGETIRLSYGNPEVIIRNAVDIQQAMEAFGPEGILLYTCTCRQIFLKESVQLETLPFERIAPTAGFYTHGEYYGQGRKIHLLNATMVAVGIREGGKREAPRSPGGGREPLPEPKSIELTSRLARFIEAVVSDLEETNAELQTMMDMDKHTQVFNRGKMDSLFQSEIDRVKTEGASLSIVLMDIDRFKAINDTYGHYAGDNVLRKVAQTLKANVRVTDAVGRWGGEEFLILFPDTDLDMARAMAERMRRVIAREDFGEVGRITASFGVISANESEEVVQAYQRVDAALYEAKRGGRNRVVVG